METIRSFIAINFPGAFKAELGQDQELLKPELPPRAVAWVRPENIHLTLKFFGNINPEQVDTIAECMNTALQDLAPFTVTCNGYGVFPNERRPRVVWVGIQEGRLALIDLTRCLEKGLAAIGFQTEKRPFKPHLTIGRIKSLRRPEGLISRLKSLTSPGATININSIDLMQSTLKPDGAQYTVLRTCTLKNERSF